jgi:DNA-directed RNA polymerase specialized sigma24 family protein
VKTHSPLPFGGDDHDVPKALAAVDVERALASLPRDDREIVLLDLQGLTEADAAPVLGIPVGTVKSRLARARAVLRVRLAAYQRQPR